MKVTVQNKNGLNKDLKVLVDKKTLEKYLNEKYEEVSKSVQLKGFRPGKVPKEVLKSNEFKKYVISENNTNKEKLMNIDILNGLKNIKQLQMAMMQMIKKQPQMLKQN